MVKKVGFTLVEMLVVIAIITSLAAIISVVYMRSREKGRQIACLSNLKQLGAALLMYAQDNDGHFPPYRNHPIKWPNNWGQEVKGCYISTDGGHIGIIFAPHLLVSAIDPYLREKGVWFCPSDPYAGTPTFYWCVFHKYTSYYFNLQNPKRLRDTDYFGSDYYIRNPHLYILAWDPNTCVDIIEYVCSEDLPDYTDCVKWNKVSGGNHFNGVNELYLDGSVKWNTCLWR